MAVLERESAVQGDSAVDEMLLSPGMSRKIQSEAKEEPPAAEENTFLDEILEEYEDIVRVFRKRKLDDLAVEACFRVARLLVSLRCYYRAQEQISGAARIGADMSPEQRFAVLLACADLSKDMGKRKKAGFYLSAASKVQRDHGNHPLSLLLLKHAAMSLELLGSSHDAGSKRSSESRAVLRRGGCQWASIQKSILWRIISESEGFAGALALFCVRCGVRTSLTFLSRLLVVLLLLLPVPQPVSTNIQPRRTADGPECTVLDVRSSTRCPRVVDRIFAHCEANCRQGT